MSEIRKLIVKESGVSGKGVFAGESFKLGDVIMVWSHNYHIISEKDYNQEQKNGNYNIIKTGARFVDGYFLYTDDGVPRIEDNMNHSYFYNVLYHCGVCFAVRDIAEGDELFVNYRYVLAKGDALAFHDKTTGHYVDGIDSFDCLRETTSLLHDLLEKMTKNRDKK